MLKQNLSAALVIAVTIFGLGFYFSARDGENSARAASLVGSTFQDMMDANARVSRQTSLRQAVRVDVRALLDVYGGDVVALLNRPEMIRRDAPTTIWQYRTSSCVLDVYFTTSSADALRSPVVHYEVRLRDGADARAISRSCVRGLLSQGRSL